MTPKEEAARKVDAALAGVAAGWSEHDAAEHAGVQPRTLRAWLGRQVFRRRLASHQRRLLAASVNGLLFEGMAAIDALEACAGHGLHVQLRHDIARVRRDIDRLAMNVRALAANHKYGST
jgi:hypothetical protein